MAKTYTTALEKLSEEQRAEYWACLALRYAKNIGARSAATVLKHFGSAYEAVHNTARWGETRAGELRAQHINDNSWRQEARAEWENARDLNAHIILWTDSLYPASLKELPDAPVFLYALGNTDLLSSPGIAVVGSRAASKEGEKLCFEFSRSLAHKGITIISGMARGIDRAAHHGALKEIGSSIGVLGCGIDVIYPPRNDDTYALLNEKGLILSEFAPGTPPDPTYFPIRNRIISGLSLGVLVIEAGLKSGSLITAKLANEQNRTVYAIPGSVNSPYSGGCQELIRQGAKPVFHVNDILEDLFPQLKAKSAEIDHNLFQPETKTRQAPTPSLSPIPKQEASSNTQKNLPFQENSLEFRIIHLLEKEKLHIDTLCQQLEVQPALLLPVLTKLEMEDHVQRHEGGWYGI